jgi:hypothetical protein
MLDSVAAAMAAAGVPRAIVGAGEYAAVITQVGAGARNGIAIAVLASTDDPVSANDVVEGLAGHVGLGLGIVRRGRGGAVDPSCSVTLVNTHAHVADRAGRGAQRQNDGSPHRGMSA